MTNSETRELMPDDIQWLKETMTRLEQDFRDGMERLQEQHTIANVNLSAKLDGLPCPDHAELLNTYTERLDNLIAMQDKGVAKGGVVVQAIIALGVIGSLIISLIALKG